MIGDMLNSRICHSNEPDEWEEALAEAMEQWEGLTEVGEDQRRNGLEYDGLGEEEGKGKGQEGGSLEDIIEAMLFSDYDLPQSRKRQSPQSARSARRNLRIETHDLPWILEDQQLIIQSPIKEEPEVLIESPKSTILNRARSLWSSLTSRFGTSDRLYVSSSSGPVVQNVCTRDLQQKSNPYTYRDYHYYLKKSTVDYSPLISTSPSSPIIQTPETPSGHIQSPLIIFTPTGKAQMRPRASTSLPLSLYEHDLHCDECELKAKLLAVKAHMEKMKRYNDQQSKKRDATLHRGRKYLSKDIDAIWGVRVDRNGFKFHPAFAEIYDEMESRGLTWEIQELQEVWDIHNSLMDDLETGEAHKDLELMPPVRNI
ncbi:hypothetical protein L486_08317 [Kwoniella mangroviensis CBS 10435]|uniref:Uncharacterized protein n=1 Tax=Kwoniella mangroviensis CBS 10435 TaxID=1331196 RepID=A0A1B9IF00_9TREE|nr:hypothetical protein L486_08317 [Kwoniella mangroviensis CBS 10435]